MTHKLSTWIDQFGSSGCVGCGRCITWCPVAIDITEEAAAIRATDARGAAMRTIEELVAEVGALQALAPEHRETIAGCARNRVCEPGEHDHARGRRRRRVLRRPQGRRGDRDHGPGPRRDHGRDAPRRRRAGLVVARARRTATRSTPARSGSSTLLVLDGACLRGKCDATRRSATRCSGCSPRSSPSGCRTRACGCSTSTGRCRPSERVRRKSHPPPFRVTDRRRETHDTWTLELEPCVADAGGLPPFAPGAVRDALRVRRRRGADLGQRRLGARRARPHRPGRGRDDARHLRVAARRRPRRARARSATPGRWPRRPATTLS